MERQLGTIDQIREDHVFRYKFALDGLKGKILDAACGCGYGSWILSHGNEVTGVDIEPSAIEYARLNYSGPKYILGDIQKKPWKGKFDAAVSFETLEHLAEPVKVLKHFRQSADTLIASVPNEDVTPFKPENFANDVYPHLRHYTPTQFAELLDLGGWTVLSMHCQTHKQAEVTYGTDGMFLVYVCV